MDFPKEMYDMFDRIREQQEANLRMCTTLVAGFIATYERDVNYMDGFMDSLYDCMEQQNEEEQLMRKYINHIATFDAQEAKERTEHLEDLLGYKSHVACAACYLAEELHEGQVDKGGKDYFISHLLSVGKSGHDWKYNTPRFSDRHTDGGMKKKRYLCGKEENQNGKTIEIHSSIQGQGGRGSTQGNRTAGVAGQKTWRGTLENHGMEERAA